MEIRNRVTGSVIKVNQLKAEHPAISFPSHITPEILDKFGYDPVLNGPAAKTNGPYEVSIRDGVEEINGQWFTRFVIGPIFADNEQESAYKAKIDARAAMSVRADRNQKLAACDWTQLADTPLTPEKKSEWATYRQSLRDLPTASDFPHAITWPDEPS